MHVYTPPGYESSNKPYPVFYLLHGSGDDDAGWSTIGRAGFKGIGLWHADIEHVLDSYTLPQMKRILDDNGLKHVEVEFLADWFLPPGERRTASDHSPAGRHLLAHCFQNFSVASNASVGSLPGGSGLCERS